MFGKALEGRERREEHDEWSMMTCMLAFCTWERRALQQLAEQGS